MPVSNLNFLIIVAAATVYYTWILIQEDKDIIRKIVFLIILVGLLVLTLSQLSLDLLRSRISQIEELVLPNHNGERALPNIQARPRVPKSHKYWVTNQDGHSHQKEYFYREGENPDGGFESS